MVLIFNARWNTVNEMKTEKAGDRHSDQSIGPRKNEMKELLMRVMREPLSPEAVERLSKLEERWVEIQTIRDETGEISATDDILKRGDVLKKLRALRDAYTYEIDSLLASRLGSRALGVAQFLQDQTSVEGLLDDVYKNDINQSLSFDKCGVLSDRV